MHFPFSLDLGGFAISAHALCEVSAYFADFLLLRSARTRLAPLVAGGPR